jgi:putative DNA primase/helicase
VTAPTTGARYFHPDYGLKAADVATTVASVGPLMVDAEGRFWAYAGGVWRLDDREVQRRVVAALGQRYRPGHLRAVMDVLASTLARFEVRAVPGWINFRNGMLRWDADTTPVLGEHHPEFMSTVQLPFDWDPTAGCRDFEAFLESALPEDDRARAWQIIGYLLMSGNPLQRLFMLSGSGGNGKGVYLNVLRAELGEDNYSAVALQDFSDNRFATAELYGKLANICGDIDSTFIQNTARIKQLSGDDKMNAERKGEHPFKFLFWGKAIFSANAIPGASDSSKGWLRRWEVLEFPYAPTKPDTGLSARLVDRRSLQGIATRAVDALRELMAEGEFARGESADTTHAQFAERANRVIRWLHDPDSNVVPNEDMWNKGTILLKAFRDWEEHDSGDANRHTGVQHFNELARQSGLRPAIRRGQRGYYGAEVTGLVFIPDKDKPHLNQRRAEVHQSAPPCTPEDVPTLM